MQQAVQQLSQQRQWQSLTREQAADLGRARKEQQRVLADLERQKRTLLKQQAEDIVMETTIEALEGVRNDPAAMSDVQHTVKKEIKATIKHLTARAASRLVRVEEVQQRTPHRLSAPRTDHVQTTDSRGDRSVWIEQDTTGQDGVGQRAEGGETIGRTKPDRIMSPASRRT